jgi:hypothetical protein
MSLAKAGITQEVIRDMMPPYHLSADLLDGTFTSLPPPPPDATVRWRHARITRLTEEIAALLPADAAQARTAAQVVVVRELAAVVTRRACAPEVTVEQLCRLARTTAELNRTAEVLGRALARQQAKPVPFFGTVEMDQVDIPALDAVWCNNSPPRETAPGDAAPGVPVQRDPPTAGPRMADAAAPGAAAGRSEVEQPMPGLPGRAGVREPVRQGLAGPALDGGAAELTRLDQGPGWTLDLQRPRAVGDVAVGAAPRARE